MGVRRIEEEVDSDFLSDAHSRTGPAESGESCESKNEGCNNATLARWSDVASVRVCYCTVSLRWSSLVDPIVG
uniref:Uncharacterized protein n=1 Tax=Tanacetum cinerariifolium TaxID=118510 RepID=A0A699KYH5_TANCI|nr:hypothetical protein [Tanacetum cinerariifolium]